MTPYYADSAVTLYHGDCRDVTAWLDAGAWVLDVTCPGVDDDCRSWIECDRPEGDPDCSDEGCMTPLPDCFLRRLGNGLNEAAEELPPGRHEFTATFNEYGDVDALTVIETIPT